MKHNNLREKERRVKRYSYVGNIEEMGEHDIRRLLRELQSHQIELEIQNEELQKTQAELFASRGRYADLYEYAPVGYLSIDAKGRIKEVNMTLSDMLGVERSRLIGKHVTDYIAYEDQDVFYHLRNKLQQTKHSQNGELRMCLKEGGQIWVEIYCTAIFDTANNIEQCRISVSDISARKHAEYQLIEYRNKLEKKVAERTMQHEERSKELETFSYSIAHDLRAPLRTITSFSQILLEDAGPKLNAEEQDYLQRVITSGKYMAGLIDDILELASVNRTKFIAGDIDLSRLASDIISELKETDPQRVVNVEVEPGLQCKGDKRFIRIAMENLLGNAWKYTSKQAEAFIKVGGINKNGGRIFFIHDNGVGFDMKYAHKLFMPFQRLHRQEEFEGTGVGLAILNRIIQRHGGEVWVESEPGKGTTFYFTVRELIEME